IGHSTRGHQYLRIGTTPIDLLDPTVARFFESLAASGILRGLGIDTARLLGCGTATQVAGQRTMITLARVLGVRVFGARKSLLKSHYNGVGLDPLFDRVLVEASELPRPLRAM